MILKNGISRLAQTTMIASGHMPACHRSTTPPNTVAVWVEPRAVTVRVGKTLAGTNRMSAPSASAKVRAALPGVGGLLPSGRRSAPGARSAPSASRLRRASVRQITMAKSRPAPSEGAASVSCASLTTVMKIASR